MGNITDKIKELPDGKDLYIFKPVGLKTDDPHRAAVKIDSLTTDDLKTLVTSHERMRQALKQIIKWEETLEVESAVLKIAREAVKGEE